MLRKLLSPGLVFRVGLVSLFTSGFVGCDYFLPNKPPYVQLLSPPDSSVFTVGQPVEIKVNAYDVDGSLEKVVFSVPLGEPADDAEPPYEYTWATGGYASGDYKIEIKALDDDGEHYTITLPLTLAAGVVAFAGPDTTLNNIDTVYRLKAVLPDNASGTWTVSSGVGGEFSDISKPDAFFTGHACQTYVLRWTVSGKYSSDFDEVILRFFHKPTPANAGIDLNYSDGRTVAVLSGNTPAEGQGLWSVISGEGGSFSNPASPSASFSGLPCIDYLLRWTISTACEESADSVAVFFTQVTIRVDAGADQVWTDGRTGTTLQANTPTAGTGSWSVVSGVGGQFTNPADPLTFFSGLVCQSYQLRWTITTNCGSASDEVGITFDHVPSPASAGPDQTVTSGAVTTILEAGTPVNGTGTWTILSGGAGSFLDIHGPNTTFTGQICSSYVLRWTVSTECASVHDEVSVQFIQDPQKADAGPDQRITTGANSTTLQGNSPEQGRIGAWKILSGEGGQLSDPVLNNSGFTGLIGNIYLLKWTIGNACGENSDLVWVAFLPTQILTDSRDGKSYETVRIGRYLWMAENLNYSVSGSWSYNNSPAYSPDYGLLYDYNAATTACPDGWHLPSDEEWQEMEMTLGMKEAATQQESFRGTEEGGMLKEAGTEYWQSPNTGANNISGFSARPAGYRLPSGLFGNVGVSNGIWSSTANTDLKAIYRALHKDKSQIGREWVDTRYGFSVRCIKNY